VKTGTSANMRDAWTVAWSSRYLVGAWVGRSDFRAMTELTGYRSAALLARRVMLELHHDQTQGLSDLSFPPPVGFRAVRVCALSGQRATDACERQVEEWFAPGQEPQQACSVHVRVAVDTRNGLRASERTPARFRELRSFAVLAPRYAAWASAHGLLPPPQAVSAFMAGITTAAARRDRVRIGDSLGSVARNARVHITSPEGGAQLLRDPEMPRDRATVALTAVVDPPAPQVVWYVDGRPFRTVDHPYATRWPLVPGNHVLQARIPFTSLASPLVRVVVQ